jgi:hypothetical protein
VKREPQAKRAPAKGPGAAHDRRPEEEERARPLRLILAAGLVSGPLAAQPPAPTLTAPLAEAIVEGCRSHASARGQSHAIAVVFPGGHLVAALRMDGNRSAGIKAAGLASQRRR